MISRLFKSILLIVNVFLILLLAGSWLAGFVSPKTIPWLTFLSLLFPIIVFLNVLAVLFWMFFKKYYFLFSLFFLLLVHKKITKTFSLPVNQESKNTTPDFSLLSYNVRVFDLYNWSNNKTTRNKIFSVVRNLNPDIACFQEYFNDNGNRFPIHDSLMQNQRFSFSHLYYTVRLPNKHNFGIATYSAYPIIKKDVLTFEKSQNLVLVSDIKINTDTLRVFNCHLESVRFQKEDYQFMDSIKEVTEARRKQGVSVVLKRLSLASQKRAEQAEIISQEIKKSKYPVVVCGDFNDVPASYTYNKIAKYLSDSQVKHKLGIGGTYTRFFPSNRIDYILYDHKIECINFEIKKVTLSDHYPIFGSYSFAN